MLHIIKDFAERNNIIYGICKAERMDYLLPLLKSRAAPFTQVAEQRVNPFELMPEAKSIIVIGVGYYKVAPQPMDKELRGELSAMAIGEDYHSRIKKLLSGLAKEMLSLGEFEYKIYVDAAHLSERALARMAGLGFIGRNGFLISEKLGSFFNIGYIITDLTLDSAEEIGGGCRECGSCIGACPANALSSYEIGCDIHKCTVYISQLKTKLTKEQMQAMGTRLYGCDICQRVCPHNAALKGESVTADEMFPKLFQILKMTKQEFNESYKKTSAGWRGLKVLKRNAIISLCNINSSEAGAMISEARQSTNSELKEMTEGISGIYYGKTGEDLDGILE